MIEKSIIQKALDKHWNLGPAAKELGIGYSTLRKYIKEYGIQHNSRFSRNGRKIGRSLSVINSRRNKKLKALEYRGGMKCTRCGFSEPIAACYVFHHREPKEKDPSWNKMSTNNWPFEKIKKELDKCDILCHNCHAIVHYS